MLTFCIFRRFIYLENKTSIQSNVILKKYPTHVFSSTWTKREFIMYSRASFKYPMRKGLENEETIVSDHYSQ